MSVSLHPWRIRTALRRSRTQWRLLAVVLLVAVLACTMITSLGLLVSATEQRGVRAALGDAPAAEREITVRLLQPTATVDAARAAVDDAVDALVEPAGTATGTGLALSELVMVLRDADAPALTYAGDLEAVADHAELVDGDWPSSTSGAEGAVPVAVPQAGADVLGLEVGDVFRPNPNGELAVEVVGTYRASAPGSRFWTGDLLDGAGHDPDFTVPNTGGSVTTDAIGPLVVAPGGLPALRIPLERLVVRYDPDFTGAAVGDVAPLVERLRDLDDRVAADVGAVARTMSVSSPLAALVSQTASSLVVTRATVVVVSLLLLVLAVAALLQTARLLTEARLGEQHLMRARGAAGRQLLALATVEAVVLAVVVAAASPWLARLLYGVISRRPALEAAGMAVDPGVPLLSWLTAAAVALLFAFVLVSPLLRKGASFVEGEQMRGRPSRRSALQRSGLDVALLVLAGVAYWQLQSYRSPVGGSASLRVDPVLAAGPALALLAGALLCVRLVPAASRLAERIGSRGRGVVAPLAAWEVGRRAHRVTAAVLLLTLALAVGTFSQSFLASWRLSQADQAHYATGPTIRVAQPSDVVLADLAAGDEDEDEDEAADEAAAPLRIALPAADAPAEPALRREAEVAGADEGFGFGGPPSGERALALGLTEAGAEALLDGRLAAGGGDEIARLFTESDVEVANGIDLPGEVHGLAATLQAGREGQVLGGVGVIVRALLESPDGVLSTVDLGTVAVDGTPHDVRAALPPTVTGGAEGALRLVGLQTVVFAVDGGDGGGRIPVLMRDIAVLQPGPGTEAADGAETADDAAADPLADLEAVPVDVEADSDWYAVARNALPMSADPPAGWQVGMDLALDGGLRFGPATVALIGWPAVDLIPAVLTADLADEVDAEPGERLTLVVDGAIAPLLVIGVVPRVPTAPDEPALVVDQTLLARALAQSGVAGSVVDEWWVDVDPAQADEYVTALAATGLPGAEDASSQVALTREMQEHPLRVATQGALWLVTLAAAALAAVGFAVHATVTLRSRSVEFAQLRAIGLARGRLTLVVAVESLLLCLVGTAFGVGLGALLGWLVGPLVAVSPDGTPPVPSVTVVLPWADIALLALEVVAVLALVVLVVARLQRTADPAAVLRLGDER